MENNTIKISWDEYSKDVKILAEMLKERKFINIYGIPRGGLVLAVCLSHILDKPIVNMPIHPKATLIVDDISDTGRTLAPYKKLEYRIATLYRKEKTISEPDYFVTTVDKWIIYPYETKV